MADKNVKKRNWAFVLYPESAPADWREQLQKTGLPCAISPLHNRDVNATGEPKKPHYHVMVFYQGPTSYNVVKRLTDGLNQPIPQVVEQVRGYYRYLTHMDNPEKAQYPASEIRTLNGFDIGDFVEMTKSEVTKVCRALMDYIRENDLMEYADLMDMTMCEGVPPEWFDVASSRTLFFTGYLRSRRYRKTGRE
ncbi:replication protein [uncultured Alistipes sp.]|uniref:replication protein n=1 Tax=uncultured Alistipes sp. TaxID=538949 RepID=UPI0026EE5EA9|nr:replication protein [uncultured Alistipes sp.]